MNQWMDWLDDEIQNPVRFRSNIILVIEIIRSDKKYKLIDQNQSPSD